MRIARIIAGAGVVLAFCANAPSSPKAQATDVAKTTPLILEKNEGEQRIFRPYPGHPEPGETFFLKVDPRNGGSAHLVLGTAELAPGKSIETHRHAHADEILFLLSGTARVHLGNMDREAHAGTTVFVPADTWVSVSNIGGDALSLTFVFSAPGFEEFMRATSVRIGEKNVPMSQAEENEVEKKYSHIVAYQ